MSESAALVTSEEERFAAIRKAEEERLAAERRAEEERQRAERAAIEAERKAVIVSGMPATGALLAGDDPAAEWRRVAADDVPAARAILKELVAGVVVLPAAVPGHPAVSDLRVVWRMP